MPRYKAGDRVMAEPGVFVVKGSFFTRGGTWVYTLEGSPELWEQRLLFPAPEQQRTDPREPGDDG